MLKKASVTAGLLLALAAVWRLRASSADQGDDSDGKPRALDIFIPEPPEAYTTSKS